MSTLSNKPKIFLTGGSGMVGMNIVHHTKAENYTVLAPTSKECNLITQKNKLKTMLSDFQPDFVIHCAGKVGGIQANIENPYGFLYDNLMLGANLIDTCKELGIKNLINLGSSCMYPKDYNGLLKEDMILKDVLEPTNEGYALAKISIMKLCLFANKQGFNYKTLIPCNLYGYWDNFNPQTSHLVPSVIRKIFNTEHSETKNVEIWGNGTTRREFMFTEDLVDFIYFSLENFHTIPDLMNVGLGVDHTIKEYYDTVKEVTKINCNFVYDLSKPTGMTRKVVDITKQTQLGFYPKTSLKEGIQKTCEFYNRL